MLAANGRLVFLAAYTVSGFAGLIYEVTWTRLLALYMGHTTAAASTVAGAFMAGLAGGAAVGGRLASRFDERRALRAYAVLETTALGFAIVLPWLLRGAVPWLASMYREGDGGLAFVLARNVMSVTMLLAPTFALGATFPFAIRWFARNRARDAGVLYAANTAGAAVGAVAAGFLLIPLVGMRAATLIGAAASAVAAVGALFVSRIETAETGPPRSPSRGRSKGRSVQTASAPTVTAIVLATTGFATLVLEIGWVRLLSLLTGPTTYAFASTLLMVITGIAVGSAFGSLGTERARQPALWLSLTLCATSAATSWTTNVAGRDVPAWLARGDAAASLFAGAIPIGSLSVGLLILPTSLGLGFGFPLALALLDRGGRDGPRQLGLVYGVNTVAAVVGSLAAGFLLLPALSLRPTFRIASSALLLGAVVALASTRVRGWTLAMSLTVCVVAGGLVVYQPPWDRDLLASGLYKVARGMPSDVDPLVLLRAGDTLYYRDGAVATVAVRRLTGTVSLSIDGKVDASSTGDMLTQKLLAHLPLLLHERPRQVLVIGLGSGVTAASAALHGVERVDVVEISPEVVAASAQFLAQNHDVLHDPRVNLIVGDGRTHLMLSRTKYDVIISEPSNPWMAGVAALFTHEFFVAARDHLAPGGVMCQWAHTYDISDVDLRSIVATFHSVFPQGTLWLVGEGDVLLIATDSSLDRSLNLVGTAWDRPRVADDLRDVLVREPFALFAQYVGGPAELARYGAAATIQSDDRTTLEFTAPRALNAGVGQRNASVLRDGFHVGDAPPTLRRALAGASASQWRDVGDMLLRIDDYRGAYRDYSRALDLGARDDATIDGFVQAAGAASLGGDAVTRLRALIARNPAQAALRVAASRLLASAGAADDAVAVLNTGSTKADDAGALVEQIASIYADNGRAHELARVVQQLHELRPDSARTIYFEASVAFLQQQFGEAAALAARAVARDPTSAAAHNLLGVSRASLGDVAAARQAFHDALSRSPRDTTTYINLGLLELRAGNRATAGSLFAEALTLDPDSSAAKQGLTEATAHSSSVDGASLKQ
jgi:spermidine synthase